MMKREHPRIRIRHFARRNPVVRAATQYKAGGHADRRFRSKHLGRGLQEAIEEWRPLQQGSGPRAHQDGDRSMNRLDPGEGAHT